MPTIKDINEKIYYTDERVREIFSSYIRNGSGENTAIKGNISNEEIIKNLEASGYTPLTQKKIGQTSASERSLKYLGSTLLNQIKGNLGLPSVTPSLTENVLDVSSRVRLVEATGNQSLGAVLGTALGQTEGDFFNSAARPAEFGVQQIGNAISKLVSGNSLTINASKAKLSDRLQNFNKIAVSGRMDSKSYVKLMSPDDKRYNISPDGDATEIAHRAFNTSLDEDDTSDSAAYKVINDNYNVEQEYNDFATDKAQKNWTTYNVKPNAELLQQDEYIVGLEPNFNTDDNADVIRDLKKDQQFPFFFEEVSEINPTFCSFPAALKPPTESFTPEFSPGGTYFGRTEKAAIYSSTQRTIGLEFTLFVYSIDEYSAYKDRINWLAQRAYAKYDIENSGENFKIPLYKSPPLIRFSVGDLYYRLGGYISSLSFNWNSEGDVWEKSIEGNRIPRFCQVSMSITVLHDFVPAGDSNFFGWSNS